MLMSYSGNDFTSSSKSFIVANDDFLTVYCNRFM